MDFLTSGFNVLLIILGFGVLIFIHELGHFIAAKWAGIRTEAFAVGMGPVVVSWRKGIGFRFGSSWRAVEQRVRTHLEAAGESLDVGDETTRRAKAYRAMDELGIGETEYSLRWLPLGGFVKMLGQEDANPNAVSDDPRSYNRCPVGKRMIVVSAGVIMNLILAVALFIAAFMAGVRLEAPVVGETMPSSPAALAVALNASELGVEEIGLQPGDHVTRIDGQEAKTFADLQIAAAMSKPGQPIRLAVRRSGVQDELEFVLQPRKDQGSGLLSIGVVPGSSTTLIGGREAKQVREILQKIGLANTGIEPGMRLLSANGVPVQTYEQFWRQVQASKGKPVVTQWQAFDEQDQPVGPIVTVEVPVEPSFEDLPYVQSRLTDVQHFEEGLFGLTPLVRLHEIRKGPNQAVLQPGDLVLRVGDVYFPRMAQFRQIVAESPGSELEMLVRRNGEDVPVHAKVNRSGMLNVELSYAWDVPIVAQPMEQVGQVPSSKGQTPRVEPTPLAEVELMPGSRIDAVGDVPVGSWAELRRELRAQTQQALANKSGATVALHVTLPTPSNERETIQLSLSVEHVAALHDLGWNTKLLSYVFEPIQITRTAESNPIRAVTMGFEETHKLVMLTYLTIDRLFRGSVGVEQLRGPLGIVHIGTKVADRGFMYILFFLGMISVNLAVLNFLPLPIVDGGLFLFLVYEKLKGRPPSLAFQNVATVVGLFIIGTLFLVVTWNDVVRLLS